MYIYEDKLRWIGYKWIWWGNYHKLLMGVGLFDRNYFSKLIGDGY
jgi:hypothetical protein